MGSNPGTPGPIRRLAEELSELNADIATSVSEPVAVIEELHYALRPPVHERRVPSYGSIVDPVTPSDEWAGAVGFEVASRSVVDLEDSTARRLADGIVSWTVRSPTEIDNLVVFNRSVGSERDMTILSESTQGVIVQRHPSGVVRAVGPFGVLRHDGINWTLQPPVEQWLDRERCLTESMAEATFDRLLRFAVHDLASRGIGATLVVAQDGELQPGVEQRFGRPPEFAIDQPSDLAPLYHVLSQMDGAAVFDHDGRLQHLGVRLVPSVEAEAEVNAYRGTRHTSALRYSFDDPAAVIVVVSEDGPISVVQGGQIVGASTRLLPDDRQENEMSG